MAIRKAEMWDKMQYLFRNYYDRMIHVACKVKGKIDYDALVKALDILLCKVDILRCSFVANPIYPHWLLHETYDVKEIINVIKSDNIERDIDTSICMYIPVDSKFQMRLNLIEAEEESAITMVFNHMCTDGGDSKYLMGKLTELYADIVNGGDGSKVQIKEGRRDGNQIYDRMSPDKKKRAQKLYKNISQSKVNVEFPFAASMENEEEKVRLFRVRIEAGFTDALMSARKKFGATINDVFLAAFFRTLYVYLDKKYEVLNIVSMMDLRRYCGGGDTLGVTNMTGFAPCDIQMADEPFLTTLGKVKQRMEQNKTDEFMGLYSIPLLKLAYQVFPHFLSEEAIKIGYQNPLIGMSNIGILEHEKFAFANTELLDCFMTGAAKYKPYMQLTATTFDKTMTFCIAEKCTERDGYILSQFLRDFKSELKQFIAEANAQE